MVLVMMTKEERLNANWEAMVKWWGLPDSDGNHRPPAQSNFSEEDEEFLPPSATRRKIFWDPAERVYEISSFFFHDEEVEAETHQYDSDKKTQEEEEEEYITSAEFEALLDEMQGYAASFDVAEELNLVDALEPLLYNVMLFNKHAAVRAKAAAVVSAIVHNNPNSQRLVMEANGLPPLLHNFTSDPDVTARTKALEAISSLIRNNKPGISAFRLANGYEGLWDALTSESVMFQREALNLIQYLLLENCSDCNIVTELGLPRIMMHLASSDDYAEVREAALRCLFVLTRNEEGGNSGQLVKNDDNLKQVLQERIEGISSMAPEDLGAAREERQLVDLLWIACYNEPSSLQKKGLLVLPGEDPPGPDVASKLFEPPTRAWAAAEATDRNSVITFNSSSSSSSSSSSASNKFGSFIFLATVERCFSLEARAGCKHFREYALLMLSSSSSTDQDSVFKSGSSTGWWQWWSTASNYLTGVEEEQPDYDDDQVFTVDNYYYYNTNLLLGGGGGGGSTSNDDDQQQQLVFKLESLGFPPCFKFRDNYSLTEIVGSCNGLVCLYDRQESKEVSLWNPATRQYRVLPKSITIDDDCPDRVVAFGFDVQTKDYKVLLVTCSKSRYYRPLTPVECLCRVQVYSLSTNSWRLLEGINCLPGFPQYNAIEGHVLYLNGSCFFIANFFHTRRQRCFTENNRFIISFDFTKEIFIPIQLPDHHRDQDLYLSSLGDKIAIFTVARYAKDDDNNDTWVRKQDYETYPGVCGQAFNIWVLNEHGSSIINVNWESWTKLSSFRIDHKRPGEWIIPRGISNDGEFAMLETRFSNGVGKRMKLYNLVTEKVEKDFLSCSMVMSKANAYKPSLVDLST